ncbi:NAD-glutamate dehydrogenase domain-containing protein [Acaricomes phytoseiuli]|uniref:NAD-glutamate dehydrogenase n=1 Tax=Acaricomes phytoseiuli TaxID=291968 RepID=UPI00036CD8AF
MSDSSGRTRAVLSEDSGKSGDPGTSSNAGTLLNDETADRFITDYYQHIAEEDRAKYDPATLRNRALTHYQLAQSRQPGEAKIALANEYDAPRQLSETIVYVVTDDMPFLVDSLTAEIVRQKAAITLVVHPMFVVSRERDDHELVKVDRVPAYLGVASGDTAAMPDLSALIAPDHQSSHMESWIAIELGQIDEAGRARLLEGLQRVLEDVRAAVEDWQPMRQKALQAITELSTVPEGQKIGDLAEAEELLRWVDQDNFTFLGYREYSLVDEAGEDVLAVQEGSGLGLLRDRETGAEVRHLTEAGQRKAREKRALVINKANSRSTVHRPGYLDYIGIKTFDAAGNVSGEKRFLGLFASTVYHVSARTIPVIRTKIEEVLRHFGFPPDSHSGKDLLSVLEAYPRDELFQIDVPDLIAAADGIMRLQERRRTRLFLRPDIYGRFMSALVYIPRDRYTTDVRRRIEAELIRTFDAVGIDFESRMSESALARLFFRIRLAPESDTTAVDAQALERRLMRVARSWAEGLNEALAQSVLADSAQDLGTTWAEAFPASYRVDFEVEDAIEDIRRFEAHHAAQSSRQSSSEDEGSAEDQESLEQESQGQESQGRQVAARQPGVKIYLPAASSVAGGAEGEGSNGHELHEDARLKLYLTEPQSLSQILPFFHHLGLEVLDERPFAVTPADGREFFLYDLGLKYPQGVDPLATSELLSEAFGAAMVGASESDSFDRLVLGEGLRWRQVMILRGYAKYLRQMGNANSYEFVSDTLLANPVVARSLVALFEASFDPDLDETERGQRIDEARASLDEGLEQVATLDADRLLRTIAQLIEATLRTNYFQEKPYLSVKFRPTAIEGLPSPRPFAEFWVYSPRVEGVHLRFGEVARGGLRWSDRREDFRTEILGLVKAQIVKNAVIVPTGAKGGFFAKRLPDPSADRAAWLAEGTESYRTFIRGMLDLSDNVTLTDNGEEIIPPDRVVRYDGDDSYLVVAADKGTAAFSDIANGISADYGFWLGDAFASGGSVGYDHKAMGITARGAWESVKQHFSEFGLDTQSEEFTVAGIGDMSGDVFGNAMLLSEHIQLVAAFDHRHIFLDPEPDAAASYAERGRLFGLPRSSWADYDDDLISEGGGVFARNVKSIPISEPVRRALDLPEGTDAMSPPEVLRAILLAPVDLLYNGGIGTYVKASAERNSEVGDRANDAIRVDGRDLRAKVVGEGGNLGLTQRGRVEAALHGVILNSDAIDNSAGVDCSDHEVNIKIFVDRMVAAGALAESDRAAFLAEMTDEVARLVLADNIEQNVMLLSDRARVVEWNPSYERFMDWLEEHAELDRQLEALPSSQQLRERLERGQGLTSPELSVLAAYAKIELTKALRDSDLSEDPWFAKTLRSYFPKQLVERFDAELDSHPLRREIIATVIANDIINIGGITFAFRAMEETNAGEDAIAKAFVAIKEIFDVDEILGDLAALPPAFPSEHRTAVHLDLRRLLDRATRWFLNHSETARPLSEVVAEYGPVVKKLRKRLLDYLHGVDRERVTSAYQRALSWGMPESLSLRWSELFEIFAFLEIARISGRVQEPVEKIAEAYYLIFSHFGVDGLLDRISALPRRDRWQALARAALRDDLYATVSDITVAILGSTDPELPAAQRLEAWIELNQEPLERAKSMFEEVEQREQDDMASLSVALRLLRSIVRR